MDPKHFFNFCSLLKVQNVAGELCRGESRSPEQSSVPFLYWDVVVRTHITIPCSFCVKIDLYIYQKGRV